MGPRVAVAPIAVAVALAVAGSAGAAPGDLDPSFGQNGTVVMPVGPNHARARDAAVQPDGKIVLAGNAFQDGTENDSAIVILRLNADGSIDGGFGSGGVATVNVDLHPNGNDFASAVGIGPNGQIVVVGSAQAGASIANHDVVVIQLTANGQPDGAFGGGDGIVTKSFTPTGFDQAFDVIVQPNSAIVTSSANGTLGFSLLRFEPDGDPDPTWDGDGEANAAFGGATEDQALALLRQPDGKILAGGVADSSAGASSDFALARFIEASGALDPDFGTGGMTTTPAPLAERITDMALGPGGRILAAGSIFDVMTFNGDMAVAAYSAQGILDPNFAGDGRAEGGFSQGDPGGLVVHPDGTITLGGAAVGNVSTTFDFTLWDLDAGGQLDPAYRGGGRAFQPIGSETDAASTVVAQPIPNGNGAHRLILAGVSFQGREQFAIGAFKIADEDTQTQPPTMNPPGGKFADIAVELFPQPLDEDDDFVVFGPDDKTFAVGREDLKTGFEIAFRAHNSGPASTTATWDLLLGRGLVFRPNQPVLRAQCNVIDIAVTAACGPQPVAAGARQSAVAVVRGRGSRDPLPIRGQALVAEPGTIDNEPFNNGQTLLPIVFEEPEAKAKRERRAKRRLKRIAGTVTVPEAPKAPAAGARVDAAGSAAIQQEIARLNGLARVEVALLRVEGRARGFSGEPAPRQPAARAAGTPRCSWLASARGTFRSERPRRGVCDEPRWLKTTLAKAKPGARSRGWSFNLAKGLPKGDYIAYTRGVNRAGLSIDTFTARAQNRVELEVR